MKNTPGRKKTHLADVEAKKIRKVVWEVQEEEGTIQIISGIPGTRK